MTAGIRGLGEGFTCHPALILVGEHDQPLTTDVGHPKSYYVDRAVAEGFVLETCMYFPFVTAKNLTGFGAEHSTFLQAFPRLQMILVLACDKAVKAEQVGTARRRSSLDRRDFAAGTPHECAPTRPRGDHSAAATRHDVLASLPACRVTHRHFQQTGDTLVTTLPSDPERSGS